MRTHITPAGEHTLATVEAKRSTAEDEVLDVLDPAERAEFKRLLRRVAREKA